MPSGRVALGQADARAADRVGHELDGLVLADHPLVQVVLERATRRSSSPATSSPTGMPVRAAITVGDLLLAHGRAAGRLDPRLGAGVELGQARLELVAAALELARALEGLAPRRASVFSA